MTLKRSTNLVPPFAATWLGSCLLVAVSTACFDSGSTESTPRQADAAGGEAVSRVDTPGDNPGGAGEALNAVADPEASPGSEKKTVSAAHSTADGDELPSLEVLEAAMLALPDDLAVVSDPTLRLETDPENYPFPQSVGGVPVRILREYHPESGVLMRIKSVREDSVNSDSGLVLHGPEWAYFNTAALASMKWWNNNVSHGPAQAWRRVGTRKTEGRFVNGERDGLQLGYSKNGLMISRGMYQAGRRVGLHEEWFASGQRMSTESYANDQLNGTRKAWDRGGLLMQLENYEDGKLHGRWSDFHPSGGNPREWGEFDSGVRTGIWERSSTDGVVLERSSFVDDRRDGVAKKWNSEGQLIEEVTYVMGVQTGPRRTWYDDGTLQSEGTLEDGLRTGYWLYQKADGEINELWSGEYEEDQRVGPGSPPK